MTHKIFGPRKRRTRAHILEDQSVNHVEPGSILVQLKAAESLPQVGNAYIFDLDTRDHNLWMLEDMPVILILFDASRRRAYWIAVQEYFRKDSARRPKQGAKSVRVYVSRRQPVTHMR